MHFDANTECDWLFGPTGLGRAWRRAAKDGFSITIWPNLAKHCFSPKFVAAQNLHMNLTTAKNTATRDRQKFITQ